MPSLASCPLLAVAAGQSYTCRDSLSRASHQAPSRSLEWTVLHFRVVSKAVCMSCLMSLGHPDSLASPSRAASSGNVNQFKY